MRAFPGQLSGNALAWKRALLFSAGILFSCCATARLDVDLMREIALQRYGTEALTLVDSWHKLIVDMASMPEIEKLASANHFLNQHIGWAEDIATWNQTDYWATPLETLGARRGDCEDLAIAKYAMLVLANVEIDKLRITYVKAHMATPDGRTPRPHMVLAYYASPDSEPLILDNLVTAIHPASKRTDLVPVYGFNSLGLWLGDGETLATTDPGAKLSRWRELLRRAAGEGLG